MAGNNHIKQICKVLYGCIMLANVHLVTRKLKN